MANETSPAPEKKEYLIVNVKIPIEVVKSIDIIAKDNDRSRRSQCLKFIKDGVKKGGL